MLPLVPTLHSFVDILNFSGLVILPCFRVKSRKSAKTKASKIKLKGLKPTINISLPLR